MKTLYASGKPFYIDDALLDKVQQYEWSMDSKGYVKSFIKTNGGCLVRIISLHHLVLGIYDKLIHHKDENPANNQVENLQISDHSHNLLAKTDFVRVYYNKQKRKWHAKRVVKGKLDHVGFFSTKEEAISKMKVHMKYLLLEGKL